MYTAFCKDYEREGRLECIANTLNPVDGTRIIFDI
jgi:hypothetical protein